MGSALSAFLENQRLGIWDSRLKHPSKSGHLIPALQVKFHGIIGKFLRNIGWYTKHWIHFDVNVRFDVHQVIEPLARYQHGVCMIFEVHPMCTVPWIFEIGRVRNQLDMRPTMSGAEMATESVI